jgi:hypothetical protein
MIVKTGNKSILSEIKYNTKPVLNNWIGEDSLHVKHPFRAIRDQATDGFVELMFKYDYNNHLVPANILRSNKRNLFLLYVYDYFNLYMISEFEYYLLCNNCKLLNSSNEYATFLFKGGNLYFHIIYELIVYHGIYGNFNQVTQTYLKQQFDRGFKVSDFDFTVNLKCQNHTKFIEVKYHLAKFLTIKLEEITIFFNSYLSDVLSNEIQDNPNNFDINNINVRNNNLSNRENRILIRLSIINDIFCELCNNDLFFLFLDAINNNVNPAFDLPQILGGPIGLNLIYHYINIISTFIEPLRIIDEIVMMIRNIRLINLLLAGNVFTGGPINITNNKEFNAKVINVISKLTFINNKYLPNNIFIINNIDLNEFKASQNEYFRFLRDDIRSMNFYSNAIINAIKQDIITKINNIRFTETPAPIPPIPPIAPIPPVRVLNIYAKDPKASFLFKKRRDPKEERNYEIVKLKLTTADNDAFTVNDINIESADDITFDTDNITQNLYINKKNNNYHYISYNSSINVSQYNNTSITNFDLLRSKFNFTLKNVFIKKFLPPNPIPPNIIHNPNMWKVSKIKIPSEFIDISIADIDDNGYNVFINNVAGNIPQYIHNYNFNFGNNIFNIKSFTVSYFIHDLITILYSQNMCPWINNKYAKRVFRLLFLYTLRGNTLPHLILLYNIIESMQALINANYRYNMVNPLLQPHIDLINNFSLFTINTHNDFELFVNNIINHHSSIKSYKFGIRQLYFHELDEFIDSIFFNFNIYLLYHHNQDLAVNLINTERTKYKYYDFTRQEFRDNYYDKIIEYYDNLLEYIDHVIFMYLSIRPFIPNFI